MNNSMNLLINDKIILIINNLGAIVNTVDNDIRKVDVV